MKRKSSKQLKSRTMPRRRKNARRSMGAGVAARVERLEQRIAAIEARLFSEGRNRC